MESRERLVEVDEMRRCLHSGGGWRSIKQVLIHEHLVSRNRGGSNMAGVGPPWGHGSRLSDQAVGGCQQSGRVCCDKKAE